MSVTLNRPVVIQMYFPAEVAAAKELPLMILFDGQDMEELRISQILDKFWREGGAFFRLAAVEVGKGRLSEYGVREIPDYAGRGEKAAANQKFIMEELLPHLMEQYLLCREGNLAVGFSLGGLAAFDLVLEHQEFFQTAGVFSGAFWWRSRELGKGYSDSKHRIIHQKVNGMELGQSLRFWFQCGTEDETSDRNGNGIIDSIDDTQDLIKLLKKKRITSLKYQEVIGGKHNFQTWGKVFPLFLDWAFQNKKRT